MKKKLALLILLALALSLTLAACSSTAVTKIIPRWDEYGTTYEYNVSLGDFTKQGSEFVIYPYGNLGTFQKDFVVRIGESFNSLDEVRPLKVAGTFTLKLSKDGDCDVVETTQNLLLTYELVGGKIKLAQERWADVKSELQQLVVESDDNSITLKSSTKTMVKFEHDSSQAPVASSTVVDGFYMGKTNQEASNYEVATTYNYEGKRPVAEITLTLNGNDPQNKQTSTYSETLKGYSKGSFIDSNQLFMYVRSFDKSSGSFQDNPSVSVFNPFDRSTQTANFSFTAAANAILHDAARSGDFLVKLPTVGVSINGLPFMLQESAPNLKEKFPDLFDAVGNGPDYARYGGDFYAKHTPVRFRVGYLSFELSSYSDELYNALSATTATAE